MTRRGEPENGLPDYLDSLDTERQHQFLELAATVAGVREPSRLDAFVFHPNQVHHSRWDDAAAVFWQAVVSLYLAQPLGARELPLLYWGFHSYNLLARRSANGVLLTDRGIYVVDAGRDSWALPLESVTPFGITVEGSTLQVGAAALDLGPARRLFNDGDAEASADYLRRVLAAVQGARGIVPVTPVGGTPEEAIAESRFSTDFQLPTRAGDAKRIAKLVAKWDLPPGTEILYALSRGTFAGIYGLAVTADDVYSRDLMEPLDRSPRQDLDTGSFGWDEEAKGFRIGESHVIPNHPAITADKRGEFVSLLSRILAPQT